MPVSISMSKQPRRCGLLGMPPITNVCGRKIGIVLFSLLSTVPTQARSARSGTIPSRISDMANSMTRARDKTFVDMTKQLDYKQDNTQRAALLRRKNDVEAEMPKSHDEMDKQAHDHIMNMRESEAEDMEARARRNDNNAGELGKKWQDMFPKKK